MKKFLLHEPKTNQREIQNVNVCLKTGWLSPSGNYVKTFKNSLSKYTNSDLVLTNSGTSALHISLILAKVDSDDEVLVPSMTFIATVNAILYRKARPIFFDCQKNNPNADVEKILIYIKNRTFYRNGYSYNKKTKRKVKAIILTHVFGNILEITKLKIICKSRNIKIIEDAAEALGSKFEKGKHAGTIGDYGVLSFNINKVITTAGGGAVFIKNKSDKNIADLLIKQSKINDVFFHHSDVGYNYGMSNIEAAIGCAQLEKINKILYLKKKIYQEYEFNFKSNQSIELISPSKFSNYWLNSFIIKKLISYSALKNIIKKIEQKGVQVRPVWFPCHKQKYLQKFEKFNLENSNKLYKKIICLPSSFFLKKAEIKKISEIVLNVIKKEI